MYFYNNKKTNSKTNLISSDIYCWVNLNINIRS